MAAIDATKFWEDGYLLVKNVFTREEIEDIRNRAYKEIEISRNKNLLTSSPHGTAQVVLGDLLSKPNLYDVILDDRLLQIAQQILNAPLVYFGDSSFQIGVGSRGYHKDNANRTDPNDMDWEGRYPIIRFGLYLQDHKKYSGGLKVRKGSHNDPSIRKGKSTLLDIEVGDIVVWSLRTSHSGNAVRMRFFPNIPLSVSLEKRLPAWLRIEEEKERVAFFFSYGIKDKRLDKYIDYLKGQSWAVNSFKNSPLPNETVQFLKNKEIELIKPMPEYGS